MIARRTALRISIPARFRVGAAIPTLALGHIGVCHRIPSQRRREIQLGAVHLEGAVVGTQRRGHAAHRRHDQTAPAGRHEMLALPRVVRDAGEIEFTSGDKDLFELAVDEVAIDVEVVDLQPSHLAAVDRETRQATGQE